MITRFVLIVHYRHHVVMTGIVIIVIALALVFLSPVIGADSRVSDDPDRRGWWPGTRTE